MPKSSPPKRTAKTLVPVLQPEERRGVYAARRHLASALESELGLRIPIDVYFQDPFVAKKYPDLAFDTGCLVPWEPGIADGPTSARFAVVDYDAHTGTLAAPARWDAQRNAFLDERGKPLNRENALPPQFRQVSVWAILQRALEFFEGGSGLGRRIPWGFEGNRLIVVPHAGPGENAYYDRTSKSLQFYYFDRGKERIQTCLSTDIVHHEFGHAVLDGIRPLYIESVHAETAAFHEFIGDLSAILMALRNSSFRRRLIKETGGDLARQSTLSGVAEQFGEHVSGKPYLRSARSPLTMAQVSGSQRPHHMSQVLTGAMFDILIRLSKHYVGKRRLSVAEAFWATIQRMQHMAIQPLDLLPPADVTFSDYARAVLRWEEIANPTDPHDYRGLMLDVFIKRGILRASDRAELEKPRQLFERLDLDVFHDADTYGRSRADAYLFLDDNRRRLLIPRNVDVVVADVCTAQKLTRESRRMPRQVILQYVWREDVTLEGARFGRFAGATTSLLCGGTLAVNQQGDVLHWTRRPGSQPTGVGADADVELQAGIARRSAFLDALAARIRMGSVGHEIGGGAGLLAKAIPPLVARSSDGTVRFELAPHFTVRDDGDEPRGGRTWQLSS